MLLGCAIALALFLFAIPVNWFTYSMVSEKGNIFNSLWSNNYGMRIQATGLNGSIKLVLSLSIWLLLGISALSIIVLMLNVLKVTAISRVVPFFGLAFPGICYVVPLFAVEGKAELGTGPIMALLATFIGLVLEFKHARALVAAQRTEPEGPILR
jgi:hypothetical protein